MVTPLSQEEVIANLNKFYHSEFEQLCQSHIKPDEDIYAVAEHSLGPYLGFTIITSNRVLLVTYFEDDETRTHFFKRRGNRLSKERLWLPYRLTPLTKKALNERRIAEYSLSSIKSTAQYEHSITYQEQQSKLIELVCFEQTYQLSLFSIILDADAGDTIYRLLQIAIKNGGQIQARKDINTAFLLELLAGLTEKDIRSCPFCSEPITLDDNLCEHCDRPPGSDKHAVLREAILTLAKKIIQYNNPDEAVSEETLLLTKVTALILCQLIDEVEERIEIHSSDCLSTASGMAVNNAYFYVQAAMKKEKWYPGATNEFHRVNYVVQEILKGKYQ